MNISLVAFKDVGNATYGGTKLPLEIDHHRLNKPTVTDANAPEKPFESGQMQPEDGDWVRVALKGVDDVDDANLLR